MKAKVFLLSFVCLIFTFCATAPLEKKWATGKEKYWNPQPLENAVAQSTQAFKDLAFDQLWETCEKTLIRLNFIFYTSNKQEGTVYVRSTSPEAKIDFGDSSKGETIQDDPNRSVTLYIKLSQADGTLTLTCHVFVPMTKSDWQILAKKELNRFLDALKKELKR